jgi:RNA polymerase primary sigma factor
MQILNTLSERECLILSKRFGLDSQEPKTLEEIGKEIGVSKERVRQLETKALKKLRHPFRAKLLKECINV